MPDLDEISKGMYFDKDGKPITLSEYCILLEDPNYKIIKQEYLPNKLFVSTVWLGLNHNFFGGVPLIFETMVFPGNEMDRYTTLEQAKVGHTFMVNKYKKKWWYFFVWIYGDIKKYLKKIKKGVK